MVKIALLLAGAAILFFGYIKYIENHAIYFPEKEIKTSPSEIGLPFEEIFLQTKDKIRIAGWYIPGNPGKNTVLILHGNAGNIADRLEKIELLAKLGVNVFIVDYRGYGKSSGRPCERGFYLDARAAYDYLVREKKIGPDKIILYGESIGGAVAVKLASEAKVAGLIIEGAFSSGRDLAGVIYPFLPSFIFADSYNSNSRVGLVEAPILVMHSRQDEVVPYRLAEKLFNSIPDRKTFVELKGSHNGAFLQSAGKYTSSIKEFIEDI